MESLQNRLMDFVEIISMTYKIKLTFNNRLAVGL